MKRGVEDHNQTSDSDTSKESLNQYIVERIIGKREVGKITQYCIKWEGFPIEQATWEPLEHLTRIKGLIKDYNNEKMKTKKKPIKKQPKVEKKEKQKQVKPKCVKQKTEIPEGNLLNNSPYRVVSIRQNAKKELDCVVEWCKNNEGITPKKSKINFNLLQVTVPLLLHNYLKEIIAKKAKKSGKKII